MYTTVTIDNQFFNRYSKDFFAIYHEAFPEYERQTDELIIQRFKSDLYKMICCFSETEELVGFALTLDIGFDNCRFIEYFAVKDSFRHQGIGSEMINKMLNLCKLNNMHLIMEVENPKFGDRTEQKLKRLDFYKKNGFSLIEDFHYILPPLDEKTPTEMYFMCSNVNRKRMRYNELIKLTENLYSKVYNRNSQDPFFNQIVELNSDKKYYRVLAG